MVSGNFVIVRDPRGSVVHVRNARTGECLGCIEMGLYEILRGAIAEEFSALPGEGNSRRGVKGSEAILRP